MYERNDIYNALLYIECILGTGLIPGGIYLETCILLL